MPDDKEKNPFGVTLEVADLPEFTDERGAKRNVGDSGGGSGAAPEPGIKVGKGRKQDQLLQDRKAR